MIIIYKCVRELINDQVLIKITCISILYKGYNSYGSFAFAFAIVDLLQGS